jgi:hypothetical protein
MVHQVVTEINACLLFGSEIGNDHYDSMTPTEEK